MMKLISASTFVILVCLVLCAQQPAPTPKKPEEPVTGVIDGKVVTESGQPLPGATVLVRAANSGTGRSATSDVDGNFRVTGLEPALYTINANALIYTTPLPSDPMTPNYYRIGETVRLELVRGGAITGTVTNSAGEPVVA